MKTLNEKVIAVVGVSEDVFKYGHRIFKSMIEEGYNVYGINPRGGKILGKDIYKGLSGMPSAPDIVITVVKPEITLSVVEECNKLGVKEIWMQPGSESAAAIELAQKYGMSVTHHSCIMLANGIW